MISILDAFYDECAGVIWDHDGLLNKTIGDAIMAIFNFPIRQKDHAAQAVRAAREMQHRWRKRRTDLLAKFELTITFASALVSAAAMLTLVNLASHIVT